ncbi:serine/threonine-protein kinase [Catenulispora pinisilvae]|uniref:serine/threonine-protein kinase n=1 Tax=Catenulispora pinisilvae TaxID=2705253 RepID=UPI001891F8EF|nr:serine/threonine-protein kinase [Catenulispora pinisilvae]
MTGSFDGFSVLEPADPAEIGRYRLYARLGAGGMGRVYLSTLPGGRPVALKVVHDGLAADPEFRRRFALEARAAQQVNGIHIAQLLDVGADDPIPWLATAYIPGPSLLEAVRLQGPLPVQTVRILTAGIARALDAIHQAGLIHRDLKPANVILAEDGPRVIDFGVARAADSTTGLTGGRVGSPQYMAPEQIRNQSATPALDVFALGALTFFAATGRPAFGEGEELAVLFRIVQEEPDLSACPQVVRDLVAACLAKDPEQRPDLAAIIRYCEGENTAAGAGWLPSGVAEMARARVESSGALLAQAPTVRNAGPRQGDQTPVLANPGAGGSTVAPAFGSATTENLPTKAGGWTTGKVVGLVAGVAVLTAAVVIGVTAMGGSSGKPTASGTATTGVSTPAGNVANSSSSAGVNTAPTSQDTGGQIPSSAGVPSDSGSQSSSSAATPAAPANTAGPLTSGNDPVAWQGQMVFGTVGIDLGKTNITYPTDGFSDLELTTNQEPPGQYEFMHFSTTGGIYSWNGSNAPARQDCVDDLNSNGTSSITVGIGTLICVKGQNYQVAVARIIAVDTNKHQATAKFVLWSQPMQ